MENYPTNSDNRPSKAQKKTLGTPISDAKVEKIPGEETAQNKPEPVVPMELKTPVERRKKGILAKFKDSVFGGNDAKQVAGHLITGVVIPGVRDIIADFLIQGVEEALFGESRSRPRGRASRGTHNNHTNYTQYGGRTTSSYGGTSSAYSGSNTRSFSNQGRANHDFDEIVLGDRYEADKVLDTMIARLEQYGRVTVADLYSLVGISPNFTDERYGWTNLSRSGVSRVSNGYLINLPRPEYFD